MLTYQIPYTEIDPTDPEFNEGYHAYGVLTFEAPNPQVARTFVEAFQRYDSSSYSDCHTVLFGDILEVDRTTEDEWFISWDFIQQDRSLREEMLLATPQSTAVTLVEVTPGVLVNPDEL